MKMKDQLWKVESLSALELAFIGDAVWEVYARLHCLDLGIRKPAQLHKACTRYVSASAQAYIVEKLYPQLENDEQEMVRRGRNAKSGHVRKNVDVLSYRHSTGFEALIGYLTGTRQDERLEELAYSAFQIIDG